MSDSNTITHHQALTVYLRPKMVEALQSAANELGATISDLVRTTLSQGLDEEVSRRKRDGKSEDDTVFEPLNLEVGDVFCLPHEAGDQHFMKTMTGYEHYVAAPMTKVTGEFKNNGYSQTVTFPASPKMYDRYVPHGFGSGTITWTEEDAEEDAPNPLYDKLRDAMRERVKTDTLLLAHDFGDASEIIKRLMLIDELPGGLKGLLEEEEE